MKKTTNQLVKEIKVKKPSRFMYGALGQIVKVLYYKQCSVKLIHHVNPKDYRDKPLIIVANHASRFDYAFLYYIMKGRRMNFVAAENEFHRTKFKFVFNVGKVIPKKNFVPDTTTIRGISQILKKQKNGCVALFPCGMSTASGAQQPSMLGTGKLLKHFGVHVLAVRIHGAYLVCPKYDLKERYGHVEIELDELFNPEQLREMSADEIESKVDEAIFCDDYEWNETHQCSYERKDKKYADRMEQLLYKCPKCGAEMEMSGHDNVIECKVCGNGATLDDKYNLAPVGDSVIPYNPREWFDWERRQMRQAVLNPDFFLEEHVTLSTMPEYGYIGNNELGEVVGGGTLRFDRNGLTYKGTRDGQEWEVNIKSENLNTLCLPVDASFFYTYASGEFLLFTPDMPSSLRWLFAVEEMYRVNGGKWQNFAWFDYGKKGFATK
ncbi:MAG: 1-acyl-sn-glycerol-3-phosphate acyltransferase [Corallococcus sp.]|nr:1-acyl-sn-glycerol-3-phosphate acyltransferase [Corallococcus sp.]